MYIGNFAAAATVRKAFNTEDGMGAAVSLLGSPAVAIYKDGNLTQVTTGATLTVDYDGVTGLNMLAINTGADGTFYASGSDYKVVLSAGTVAGVSVVGKLLAEFSINNRTPTAAEIRAEMDVNSTQLAGGIFSNLLFEAVADSVSAVLADTAYMQPRVPAAGTLATTDDVGDITLSQTPPNRSNYDAARAYQFDVVSMSDGTYKAVGRTAKQARFRPGAIQGDGIPVQIFMDKLFGSTKVRTVGTPTISGGSLTVDDPMVRDTSAMFVFDGTATAGEERTATVLVTMDTGESIPVTIDVKVFGE
jgi:hypothetical protein